MDRNDEFIIETSAAHFAERAAEILKRIFEEPSEEFPAQMIQPINGSLTWLMDRDAAAHLTEA